MATTVTATEASAAYAAKGQGPAGNLKVASAVKALHSSPTTNDVIEMVKVPADAVVTDVVLHTEDLDSGSTPALSLHVGYGGDVDYWVKSETTVGQAAGVKRADAATAKPLAFTAEDTIDVKLASAPQTATTNDLSLSVYYFIDEGFSTS